MVHERDGMALGYEDRWLVLDLLARYNRFLDDGAVDRIPELFTTDGVLEAMGSASTGHAEIRRAFVTIAPRSRPHMQHLVTNVLIESDGGECVVESDFTVICRRDAGFHVLLAGRYRDRLVRRDDASGWLFSRRTAVSLAPSPD